MNILMANDDGINSSLLQALAKFLAKEHQVYIVAPYEQQSGMAQALTLHKKVVVHRRKLNLGEQLAYAVEGTPADCVKIGLESLLKDVKIDLVISGINDGYNLGTDVIYSGTVGAATEGYLHGVNALALSMAPNCTISEEELHPLTKELINKLFTPDQERNLLYNVNFPPKLKTPVEFTVVEQGVRCYEHEFVVENLTPETMEYHIIGKALDIPNKNATDISAVLRGEVAITPLGINRTDFLTLEDVNK